MKQTVELFSGTGSFSKVAKDRGFEIYRVDYNQNFDCEEYADLSEGLSLIGSSAIAKAFLIWMSPPCNHLTLASGNKYWTKDRKPKGKEGEQALNHLMFCKRMAEYCIKHGKFFVIENPMAGRATWFLPSEWRSKVWYCQYGDTRAKPTYLWHNIPNWKPKECFNGNKLCHHESAPRGSKTGTQGLKGAKERAVVPAKLIHEIFDVIDGIEVRL